MEAKGLGTPATRAAIIEGLIYEDYMHRNGRELLPTPKAFSLMFALQALRRHRDHLARADRRLGVQAEADGTRQAAARRVHGPHRAGDARPGRAHQERRDPRRRVTRSWKRRARSAAAWCRRTTASSSARNATSRCGEVSAGREWSPEEVAELITKRFIGPLTGFRSRMGKPFSAGIRLNDEFKIEFDFGQAGSTRSERSRPISASQESLGACPKCGARVFEHGIGPTCARKRSAPSAAATSAPAR